jgi:hypothetical protein
MQHSLLVFWRFQVRISAGTPTILTDIFHCFPLCIQKNSVAIPNISSHRFLPYPLQFNIHCRLIRLYVYVIWVADSNELLHIFSSVCCSWTIQLRNFCLLVYSLRHVKVRIYKTIILPVVLYGWGTWSLTLRKGHRLTVGAGIANGYGLYNRRVRVWVPVGSIIFSSPRHPDRLWGPPSLLSSGYRGSFAGDKAAGVWSWPLTSN